MSTLSDALNFLDNGYRIFGLYGEKNGECGCSRPGCLAAYKHPTISNWQVVPEWSEEQLEGFEALGHFNTGYGVLVSGLLVIDVDARNGGTDSYARLVEDLRLDFAASSGLTVLTGSGSGSMHIYYKAPEGVALIQNHKKYPGIDFKSSGFCVGPGSLHASGNRYETLFGSPKEIGVAPDCLVELLKRPDTFRADRDGMQMDITTQEMARMLTFISPSCDRPTWISIGFALHHATGGSAFELWDNWSSGGDTYPGPQELRKQWDHMGKKGSPITLGTLFHYAEQGGWKEEEQADVPDFPEGSWMAELAAGRTVAMMEKAEVIEAEVALYAEENGLDEAEKVKETIKRKLGNRPFDIDDVDLLRPPGFVGEVCKWINGQSRYPRENLAVAGAIQSVGNICGLRYTDDYDGVTANLFTLCVAASSTGKEAVLNAVGTLHRTAGVARAVVGSIKSEQEIIRNLIDNQAAYYVIDEFGIILKTITTSKEAYHTGVVGTMMAAYSKADSFLQLNGDTKREVRKILVNEQKTVRKMISENEGDRDQLQRREANLDRAIKSIDNGLERPYLSMLGFTTPVTFESLVTPEQATNGFIGRSIIVTEKDTNPRAKPDFKKAKMSARMEATLMSLYAGLSYDPDDYRVENYDEREEIPTTAEAKRMLDDVYEWGWQLAESHKEKTGLESIPRRAREMVSKLSLILAAAGRIRTAEHVRWAFAFIERDIREKCALAYANELEQTAGDEGVNQAIRARIMTVIDDKHGESQAVLINRCKKWSRAQVITVINMMVDKGQLVKRESIHARNGTKVEKYHRPETEE
ncbi:DNA primase/polymerase / DNA replication licensing factor [Pseudomonas phage DDSR119]|nr:DNA primase/polymerase / DNA replication licensing factor [Pseudomonas phage DDSR119]